MSRNFNLHAVACHCPWCEESLETFGESDLILLNTTVFQEACREGKQITDAQIDKWVRS
jgi:hypothetical protein